MTMKKFLAMVLAVTITVCFSGVTVLAETVAPAENDEVKAPAAETAETNLVKEDAGIEISEENFPDEMFMYYVMNFDADEDGFLSAEECAAVTEIGGHYEIETDNNYVCYTDDDFYADSLQGIEFFPNLQTLVCQWSEIEEVDLSQNTKLEFVNFMGCYGLCELDVTDLAKLRGLEIEMTGIADIDITENPDLEIFYAYGTWFEGELDFSENKKLVRIDLNCTDISGVEVSECPELFALNLEMTMVSDVDVTKNPKLFELYLTGDSGITSLDITKNPKLKHLRLSGTSLTTIDTSKNPELWEILNYTHSEMDMRDWEDYIIEAAPIKRVDFSNNKKLASIDFSGAPLKKIDVTMLPELEHLKLADTNIAVLDVTKNTKLHSLDVSGTNVTTLDISKNKALTWLAACWTSIKEFANLDLTEYKNLNSLQLNMAGVETIKLNDTPEPIYGSDIDYWRTIDLENNNIAEFKLPAAYTSYDSLIGDQWLYEVDKSAFTTKKYDLHKIVSDLSNVTIIESEDYEYDAATGIITFLSEPDEFFEAYEFQYSYDTGDSDVEMNVSVYILKEEDSETYTERIQGSNRVDTGLKIADRIAELTLNEGERFETVVVATADNYPDALTASYLAASCGAPILLVSNNDASRATVENYIKSHVEEDGLVYIIGGVGAVSDSFEKAVKTDGFEVKRLAGANRYDTNLAILEEAGYDGGDLIIAKGSNYPDALSAAATGEAIMLVDDIGGKLTDNQKTFLQKNKGMDITIVGGGIGAGIKNTLNKNGYIEDELIGKSRYETSKLVAEKYFPRAEGMVIATGDNYPDALAGGVLANVLLEPMVLVYSNEKAPAAEKASNVYAKEYFEKTLKNELITLGGQGAVREAVVKSLIG